MIPGVSLSSSKPNLCFKKLQMINTTSSCCKQLLKTPTQTQTHARTHTYTHTHTHTHTQNQEVPIFCRMREAAAVGRQLSYPHLNNVS